MPTSLSGQTFRFTPPCVQTEHLYIILSEPDKDGDFVIVNLTSTILNREQLVLLKRGDHPYITENCIPLYSAAALLNTKDLIMFREQHQVTLFFEADEPCEEWLLKKIRAGLLQVKHIDKKIQHYCKQFNW